MRETGTDDTLARPLGRVRADSELALASVLGLAPGAGAGAHHMRAGAVYGLVLALAVVLALLGLDAVR